MQARIANFLKNKEQTFNIIEEFAALSPKRKMLLCDHLFAEGRTKFGNTVKVLWPDAGKNDIKKLENFLVLLKKTAH